MDEDQIEVSAMISGEVGRMVSDFADAAKLDLNQAMTVIVKGFMEMQNAISWNVGCTNCANQLDRMYEADRLRDQAEAEVARLRELVDLPITGSQKIAEIQARWENATEGPWWSGESERYYRLHGVGARIPPQANGIIPEQIVKKQILKAPKDSDLFMPYWPDAADDEFIKHAWEDIRDLRAKIDFLLKMPKRIAMEIYDACPTPGVEHAGGHCDFEQCSKIALEIGRKMREEL